MVMKDKSVSKHKAVLLSFDIEEFDLPKEHGAEISLEEGVKVSAEGLTRILKFLKKTGAKATFFITGNFAEMRPSLVLKIRDDGHEIACHGVDHFQPSKSDICESKKIVEKIADVKVAGYRQPRMGKIDYEELKRCGYKYDSSVNPAFIPGRYNHLNVPRVPFEKCGVVEVPTSVATFLRVPLFWLALHLFPIKMYIKFARMSLKKTGYFATYFHPWEFADLEDFKSVPSYIKNNSGEKLVERLEKVIVDLQKKGVEFVTYGRYVNLYYNCKKKRNDE